MSQSAAFWITLLVMTTGVLGTLLPALPGAPLIFLAALGYGFIEDFDKVTPLVLVVLFVLMVITFVVDYLSGVIGAKRYGASKYGMWGSLIGGIVGVLVFSVPGLLLGPFLGAITGEIVSGRKVGEAFKTGFGTVLGMAGGAFVKVIISVSMVVIYVVSVV